MTATRVLILGMLVLAVAGAGSSVVAKPRIAEPGSAKSSVGEAIYLKGVLGSGAPLTANRAGAEPVTGEQAACVNCHRRSGLASQEAPTSFTPIPRPFL